MNKFYPGIVLIFLSVLFAYPVTAQQLPVDAVKKKELADFSSSLNNQYRINHQKALDLAVQKGWLTTQVRRDGRIVALQGLDALGFPVYLTTYNNIIAAATTQTNTVQPGGVLGLNLTGSSTALNNKLAIWDGGAIYAAHQEFNGKTITTKDGTTAISDHSTHVAGTMIAKGIYAPAKGMSFGATTLQSYDFNNDATEMAAAASNLLISNHSYGYLAGWYQNGDQNNRWEWYGLPGDNEDYKFGFYDSNTQAYDRIAFNAPYYLIVQAAGNNRGETGPVVGGTYYGYASRTNSTMVLQGPRPANISSNNGYDIISTTATAKNILTVGAVNPLPNGPSTSADVQVAYFSSWGPTDDGRVKPDICGDGVNVLSTGVTATDAYLTLSGTSMATPNVSGSLYLLQEYYMQKNGSFMLSSTLKGLVCHTAFDAGNPGPDYIYGWGLLDMSKAAQAITDNGTKSIVTEKTLAQGQTQTYNVISSGSGPLRATIAWTDPAGAVTATGVINSRTPKLVNDLDIRVSTGANTFSPWVLDYNNPSANAGTGDNTRDNVEQVYIANTVPGTSYTITVTHKGTLTNSSQPYSLIVTGVGGSIYCTSNPTSSADSRINNVSLAQINNTPAAGCTTYANYTNLTATLEQGKTYPLSVTLGTCGANFNKIAKVYIDWNANGSFADAGDLVATSGVINGTGTFNANITVPASVVQGTFSLMRVVLTETTDPAAVVPCGTYAKGETEDYKVTFIRAGIDAGVTAINNPAPNGNCPNSNSTVSVRIKNYGTSSLSSIPVNVTLTSATGVVTTLNETFTGTLAPLAETDFTLTGTFAATAGLSYTVTAATAVAGDLIITDNQATASAVINTSPVVSSAYASYCTDAKTYNLTATGDGQVFWYKNIGDAIPFTYGANVITPQIPTNNNYYAGLNDFNGNVGPVTKNVYAGGGYNQYTPAVYFTTQVPVLIQSARLYVGNSGKVTFTASTAGGQVVSTVTLDVVATRSNPGSGALPDDSADQGKIYNLNLALPAAGTYTISASYPDNATLFRNMATITGYPFSIGNIFSISGNNATSTTNSADTSYYRNYYYYFYNMHVQSLGCPSTVRTAVPVVKPAITLSGVNLVSNFSQNNQWYLNGNLIAGAAGATYKPLQSGIYRVDVTSTTGCSSKSDDFSFVLPAKDNSDGSEIALAIFPVPSSGQVNLAFNALKTEELSILIYNMLGQRVYHDVRQLTSGAYNTILNLSDMSSGAYYMHLIIGDKTYTRKISIIK